MYLPQGPAQTYQSKVVPITWMRVIRNCIIASDPVIIKEIKWEIRAAEYMQGYTAITSDGTLV